MNPNESLLVSVKNSKHTADLAARLGEVPLDSLLQEGVIKDIPIIGTAITLWKAGNDVSAYFFAKKVVSFLTEIEKISAEKRKKFLENECADAAGMEHVGEVTLMLIDKMDHPVLAKLLGRAFSLMVYGTISRQTFEIYSYIIKDLNPYLIRQLEQYYQNENLSVIDAPAATQLSNYDLVKIEISPNRTGSTNTMPKSYLRTEFGKFFYEQLIKSN